MKYIKQIFTLLSTLILLMFISKTLVSCDSNQKNDNDGYVTISGTFGVPAPEDLRAEIKISKIVNGKEVPVATTKNNSEAKYGFYIKPDEPGLYVLRGVLFNETTLYLKGNQTFNIDFDFAKGFTQTNIPDEENRVLYEWNLANDKILYNEYEGFAHFNGYHKTYEEFFPFYEQHIPLMKKQHENVNTKNKKFNKLMHALIDLNIEQKGLHFIFTPRLKHPKAADIPSYYGELIKGDNFKTAIALELPNGISTLGMRQTFKRFHTSDSTQAANSKSWMVNDVENDTLRAYYTMGELKKFKDYDEDYLAFIEPLREILEIDDNLVKEVFDYELTIRTMDPGTQGVEFTFNDINGEEVSFSDFRGKIVYIDCWATWCVPCIKEIPYLKQLEKDFHGKDIVFVSFSTDKPEHKEKWEEFVKKEQLGGVQLISDNGPKNIISDIYVVNTIPRFLLFDREGKIIDTNAKRPSQPELKKQLEALLK